MSTDQLATRAVDALAAVRSIAIDNSHPMRHIARSLKHEAEAVLSEAFTRAYMLATLADQAMKDYDHAKQEGDAT